jgi:glycine/D-amino acid oxidase-like deaminating enzyme
MLATILALAQLAPLTVDLSPSLQCPAPVAPEALLELPAGCPAPFGGVLWPDREHDDTRAACARAAAAARSRGAELVEMRAALDLARGQRDDVTRRC